MLTAWVWLETMHPGSCMQGSGGSGLAPKDPARGPVMPFCRGGCSVSVARMGNQADTHQKSSGQL